MPRRRSGRLAGRLSRQGRVTSDGALVTYTLPDAIVAATPTAGRSDHAVTIPCMGNR